METEKERKIEAPGEVRAQRLPREEGVMPPAERRRGMDWALILAGALILALVAFVSGVRMGKGLSDFKHTEAPLLGAQARGQKSLPFHPKVPGGDSSSGQEAKGLSSEIPRVRPPGKVSEDRLPRAAAKGTGPEITKGTPPPKANFALQVGAFSNSEEARDLVDQLRSKGYSAYLITGNAAAKGTLYRVRIGQFQTLQEARQFALAFEKKEKVKTIIASLE
jgi:hypothetical protein